MFKIGFQNFRKFIDFEPIEYGPITFLVGTNNSGKSTLVKAILLLNNYFKSGNLNKFEFGEGILESANIVTFGRAKHQPKGEDSIKFIFQFDKYLTKIQISGDEYSTAASVYSIEITDTDKNLVFIIHPKDKSISITRNQKNEDKHAIAEQNASKELLGVTIFSRIHEIEQILLSTNLKKTSKEYLSLVDELNYLKKKYNYRLGGTAFTEGDNLYYSSGYYNLDGSIDILVLDLLKSIHAAHDIEFKEIYEGKEQSENFVNLRGIVEDDEFISRSILDYVSYIQESVIYYIPAQPSKQSSLFLIRDKANFLGQSINAFYQHRILKGDSTYQFVERWMKEFKIGETFSIELLGGEAYELKIRRGKSQLHLADSGMGTLQIMMLLLRFAAVIHEKTKRTLFTPFEVFSDFNFRTIVIEEPELNLHPAFQSILADLMYEVNKEYKINFIVETHSEYLIRNTQLIVKDRELEMSSNENPFCVLYFDTDLKQRKMSYREDGKFIEEFGTGFFDETRKIVKKMME